MKQFLGQNCRRAGKDKRSKDFDWKNKRALSLGRLAPNFHKEEQEPQNINIYVDVSGSVNKELLEVIAKSLSIFCNQYEYTGINIIPWASQSNGIHEVESVKKSSPEKVAKEIYGADGVTYAPAAERELKRITDLGMDKFPVCMAKTQYSLSDDAKKLGRPTGFKINVREVYVSAGAGFVVAINGAIMTMPGLPKKPAAYQIDVNDDGVITGLF